MPAAPPRATRRRDFVPWRFSDAGRRSAWSDHRCRRPKTCTTAVLRAMQIAPSQCRYHAHVIAEYRLTIDVAQRCMPYLRLNAPDSFKCLLGQQCCFFLPCTRLSITHACFTVGQEGRPWHSIWLNLRTRPKHGRRSRSIPKTGRRPSSRWPRSLDAASRRSTARSASTTASVILEAPDETTVTAFVLAAIAPGHLRATKTTVLMRPGDSRCDEEGGRHGVQGSKEVAWKARIISGGRLHPESCRLIR